MPQGSDNKFSLFDAPRLQELTDGLQEALGARQAAVAEEAQRVAAAGAAVADFRKAVGEFSVSRSSPVEEPSFFSLSLAVCEVCLALWVPCAQAREAEGSLRVCVRGHRSGCPRT